MATLRETPKEAKTISHQLMLRAGMIQQIASGIYAWLPLGLRVLKKIENIIRQEQDAIGALEVLAPTLQPAALWEESGRYNDYGKELLHISDRHNTELLYGPTAEEVMTVLFRTHVKSYRDLPLCLYNIQWKFRDEIRPRFGVMRGREFLMKDSYSFDLTKEGAEESYEKIFNAYIKTFARMGLNIIPLQASTGPIGGDLSHEFHILAETGESTLYYDELIHNTKRTTLGDFNGIYAMADEKHDPEKCSVPAERLKTSKGIEVGHIFYFGTKYSKALNAYVTTRSGDLTPAEMGSYGIGVSRLVGALIETFHDQDGIKWPVSVAPFTAALACVSKFDQAINAAEKCYTSLRDKGIDVFFYDIEKRAGEVFADLDLIGFPYQIIIGKTWVESGDLEIKERASGKRIFLSLEEGINYLCQHCG